MLSVFPPRLGSTCVYKYLVDCIHPLVFEHPLIPWKKKKERERCNCISFPPESKRREENDAANELTLLLVQPCGQYETPRFLACFETCLSQGFPWLICDFTLKSVLLLYSRRRSSTAFLCQCLVETAP